MAKIKQLKDNSGPIYPSLSKGQVKDSNIDKPSMTGMWFPIGFGQNNTAGNGTRIKIEIPEEYRDGSLKVMVNLEMSADGWVDVRALDASGTLLKHTTNQVRSLGAASSAAGASGVNYIAVYPTHTATSDATVIETTSYRPTTSYWRCWSFTAARGFGFIAGSAKQENGTQVRYISLECGGTMKAGCTMQVFAMKNAIM